MRILITSIFLFYLIGEVFPQQVPYRIGFVNGDFDGQLQLEGETDSTNFLRQLTEVKNLLFAEGHLLTNVDSLVIRADSLLAKIYVGPIYYWHSLGTANIPQEYLSRSGYRPKEFQNREVSPKEFRKLAGDIINEATNNGYPFASLQLTDVEVMKNSIKGVLAYQPGPVIRYDTLTVTPSSLVNARFLEAFLDIRRDDLFSIAAVRNIETAISYLPYASLKDSATISFENNLCNVSFGLEKKKANRFDAIIGFLPNQGSDNSLRITGYADLHLENLFRSGKALTFQWQQFQPLSQILYLNYDHPNLLRSDIGFGLTMDLIKQDSLFLNTDITVDIFYAKKNLEVGFVSDLISARQISTPQDTTQLPAIGDYNMNLFGLKFSYDQLGGQTNPRSGIRLMTDLKIGGKNIRKNASIAEAVYDSIKLSTTQFHFELTSEFNKPVGRSFVFHTGLSGGAVLNNDRLFVNDLLRLGGVNSLRGFNELELFVSSFALTRLEMRLLMNESSRLFLFYDQAYTYNDIINNRDFPLGFGAGIYLGTGAGNLQLIYALGVSQEQSLSLDQSKIHIGYVASF